MDGLLMHVFWIMGIKCISKCAYVKSTVTFVAQKSGCFSAVSRSDLTLFMCFVFIYLRI